MLRIVESKTRTLNLEREVGGDKLLGSKFKVQCSGAKSGFVRMEFGPPPHARARIHPYRVWSGSMPRAAWVSFILDMLSAVSLSNSRSVFSSLLIRDS